MQKTQKSDSELAQTLALCWQWTSSLWPHSHERHIARRYLFRRHTASWERALTAVALLAMIAVEIYYFFGTPQPDAKLGMLALVMPVVSAICVLNNFLSVFSTVAVMGVMLGVAALTVVMAVTSGFQAEIRDRVIGLNAHVLILRYGTDFSAYEEVGKQLSGHPEVIASSPFVYNEMLVAKEGALSAGVLVKGIDSKRSPQVLDLGRWMQPVADGSRPQLSALDVEASPNDGGPPLPGAFVGAELQHKLKLKVGDRVRLMAPLVGMEMLAGEGTRDGENLPPPRAQEFRLAGVFAAGFDEYDRRLMIVSLGRAQQLVGQGDVVTGMEVRVRSVDKAQGIGEQLVQRIGGAPYRSLDWEGLNHNLFTALALQKAVLTLVLFLIILVAAFNIVASLTMMVIDKTREVAILKAMGMSEPAIASVFRIAGMAIGTLGICLGIGMGLWVCLIVRKLHYLLDAKVYMIDKLPTQISPTEIIWTAALTMLIALFATLYPSINAARLKPVDGLRDD